jgi:hypothetical protein
MSVIFCAACLLPALPAQAGTQDFSLVNNSGFDIYELYISESHSDDWEEDVMGENVLSDGERLNMSFRGRAACLWDILAVDSEGTSVTWSGINLCEVSVVVLRCGNGECWAEME